MRYGYRSLLRLLPVLGLFTLALSSVAQPVVTTLTSAFSGSGGVTLHPTSGELFVGNFGDAFGNDPSNWGRDVKRVAVDGTVSVFATGFFVASGNTFAADGETLLQVELGRGIVFKVAPNGSTSQWASGFVSPVGITASPDGGAYVAECGGNTITRVEPDGSTSEYVTHPEFNCPNGITRTPDGTLYTVNFNDGKIFRIGTDQVATVFAVGPGGGNGHIAYAAGRLFVADRSGHQVLELGSDGSLTVIAGSGAEGNEDGPALDATFRRINGIAVTPDASTIYVSSKVSEDPAELNPVLIRVISGVPVANEEAPELRGQGLLPVTPNPSRGATTIRYRLDEPSAVELTIHSILGRRVAVLESARRGVGEHTVTWDGIDASGRGVAAGTYVCRLETQDGTTYSQLLTLVH